MFQFQQKLKFLKGQIKSWNKETFGNIFQAQQDLNKEMKDLQQQIITEGYKDETLEWERHIHNQLEERRKQEEILWKQKSRIRWLKEGEKKLNYSTELLFKEECTMLSLLYKSKGGKSGKPCRD